MNTNNRKYRTILMGLVAALALSACAPAPQSSAEANAAMAHEVATTPAMAVASTAPVTSSTVLPPHQHSEVKHTFYTEDAKGNLVPVATDTPAHKPKSNGVPADGAEYTTDLQTMTSAIHNNSPGRYLGLPNGFTATGYPIFPATCTFFDDHSECQTSSGEAVDEAYLANKVVVMRNIDVLNTTAHICGTQICVDENGNVIGHVSKQMVAWRKANCTWAPYGTAKCKK